MKKTPLLPLLHSLSTDEEHWHTGVTALLGHTGTNGVSGVSVFHISFDFFLSKNGEEEQTAGRQT